MKFLVVGCGSIGERHIRNLRTLKVGELIAHDVNPERCHEVEEQYGIKTSNDLNEALAQKPDIALICTPTSLHISSALSVAQSGCHLFADCKDVSVLPFNWYDDTWEILESLEGKALVFTRHSIEQLSQVKSIMPTFAKYKDKIVEVVHLEPVYEQIDERSTLGLMRQAYTLMNDYNTDLLTTLNSMRVQIVRTDIDLIGANPLNPTSLVQWKFEEE